MTAFTLLGQAGLGLSPIAQAVKALYRVVDEIDTFIEKHLTEMKASDKPLISRTGRVIDAAKAGFGIGYITPIAIIAAGQLLLGNTLQAVGTVASAVVLSNPIAMTCAAVGAVYYGWGALADVERDEILERLSKGLEIGIELIKAIVRFVLDKTKELLSSENLKEMKEFVSLAAAAFGKTISDITKKIADVVSDAAHVVKTKAGEAAEKASDLAAEAYDSAKDAAEKVSDLASEAYDSAKETAGNASNRVKKRLTKASKVDKI